MGHEGHEWGTRGTAPEAASDAEGTRARGARAPEGRRGEPPRDAVLLPLSSNPPRRKEKFVPSSTGRVTRASHGTRAFVPTFVPRAPPAYIRELHPSCQISISSVNVQHLGTECNATLDTLHQLCYN